MWQEEVGRWFVILGVASGEGISGIIDFWVRTERSFPSGSVVKNLPVVWVDLGSIPGSGRSPGGGNGNSLQYFCLGNPMDRGAWQATVHGVSKESGTTQCLNNNKDRRK